MFAERIRAVGVSGAWSSFVEPSTSVKRNVTVPEGDRAWSRLCEDTLGSWIGKGTMSAEEFQGVTRVELGQASRNHGMHLEGPLRRDAAGDALPDPLRHPGRRRGRWTVEVDGLVERAAFALVDDLRSRPAVTAP